MTFVARSRDCLKDITENLFMFHGLNVKTFWGRCLIFVMKLQLDITVTPGLDASRTFPGGMLVTQW